jgi:hypothetical protein
VRRLVRISGPLVAAALGVACGNGSRPPLLGDTTLDDGGAVGDDAGPVLVSDGSILEKNCGVGPDGGVCACADEALLGDPPTLYFVLDRSGSMNGSNKWSTIQIALEKIVIALGPRAQVGAAVFPDPAQDQCAPGVEVFASRRGDAPAGTPGPTELALLQTLGHIAASGGTPTAATLQKLAPTLQAIPGKTFVILATDGGPNCDASATCTAATCTANIENTPGCPPGGPTCCTDPTTGGPLSCLDSQPTIDAVTALAKAGIPVYVVGVPGSQPYADLLDQLATAGGTARGSEPQYYAVDTADQAAFYSAMSKVAAKIAGSCILTLNQVPPDPSLINVFLDGTVLPQSGPDGWTLNGTIVTLLGASCQAVQNGDVIDVRVVAGCPTVTQ